jgi:hypothetical protein
MSGCAALTLVKQLACVVDNRHSSAAGSKIPGAEREKALHRKTMQGLRLS